MRGILAVMVTGGVFALAGTPVSRPEWPALLQTRRLVAASLSRIATPAAGDPAEAPGAEAASLLMLAGGLFAAAAIVRRRQ
jgi:hypothetical protein